jgi:hypothetical protein
MGFDRLSNLRIPDLFVNVGALLLVQIVVVAVKFILPYLDPDVLVLIAAIVVVIVLYLLLRRDGGDSIAIVTTIVGAVLVLIASFIVRDPDLRLTPSIPAETTLARQAVISVPANQYWFKTGIEVAKGDYVELEAKGQWYSGISITGPKGDRGILALLGRRQCGMCPVVNGNLGELVGKIGDDFPFRIGNSAIIVVTKDDNLWLAMNENTGYCTDMRVGSCYDDNNGLLQVRVTVWRIP